MAYRRRQGITRSSTFKEEICHPPPPSPDQSNHNSISSPSSSLVAQAIRASAAHRDSSLSFSNSASGNLRSKNFAAFNEDPSSKSESKSGFWGVLARKAKAILEEDNAAQQYETSGTNRFQHNNTSTGTQEPCQSSDYSRKPDNPTIRKGLDAITSSLNHLGDTFEKAFEEGRSIVENKTADIIQETRKIQIRRKANNSEAAYHTPPPANNSLQQQMMQSTEPHSQTIHETQLKASRDVAMATAAKAKLLLRELKTMKADLAFAKERCAQLEEENKILRENRDKGHNRAADDDLIRLQLETLLAEKARLAHENSIYARENRFLREIVEYHQLTMQDVVYLDEGMEEVTEVYPISSSPVITRMHSLSPRSPTSPPPEKEILLVPTEIHDHETSPIPTEIHEEEEEEEGTKRDPLSSS